MGIEARLDEERLRLPWYSASVDSTYLTGKRVFLFGDGTHVAAAARIARDEMGFEVVGDAQLARFVKAPANEGRVLNRGVWRYTRHPNYFGEFLIWWGHGLIGCAAGGLWSLPGPILMSVLLLRVSGVTLLEKDIAERRPGYADYVRRTNAFFPGPPRRA